MRSKGTAAELEARRRLAVRRVDEGWSQKDVAAFLGVHPVTVAKWVARHRADGDDGLAAKPTPGRPRFLTADQERKVLGWLAEPPTEHGFRTDLWTARRVAELIRPAVRRAVPPELPAGVADRSGATPRRSRPGGRGSGTRRPSTGGWRRTGRGFKKSRGGPRPPRPDRRDRAVPQPAGPPDVGAARADAGDRRGRRAPDEGVGDRGGQRLPGGPAAGVVLRHPRRTGTSRADEVVEFLRDLLRHLRGKVVVVWDGGANHKGPVIRAFLRRNKRLRLERLPAYAPDLNPVEAVWSWLKYGRVGELRPGRPGRVGRRDHRPADAPAV